MSEPVITEHSIANTAFPAHQKRCPAPTTLLAAIQQDEKAEINLSVGHAAAVLALRSSSLKTRTLCVGLSRSLVCRDTSGQSADFSDSGKEPR